MVKALEKIFSVKNDKDKKHKVINICGAKVKLKKVNIKQIVEDWQIMHDKSLDIGIPDDITLQLMFNNDCNCRCKFCSAHNQTKQTRKVMPSEWLYNYFEPIYKYTKNIVPTYGEITYGKEGYEYVSYICEKYPKINFLIESNGILFDKKWRELAAKNLFSVNFSVNAIDEESFKRTVWDKDGVFTVVKRNIQDYIKELEQNNLQMFNPSISCVLNSTNYQNTEAFVKMALEWKLQKIIFFFDHLENNLSKLSVKDRENFDKSLFTLLELERLLKGKVQIGFRLFIPIANIQEYEKIVNEKPIEYLKEKYKDIWELAQDLDLYENYLLKKKEYKKQNKNITFYEDLTGICYHTKNYKNNMICENPWNHIRLRPDGKMEVCPWRGYRNDYKIQNFIENGKINFNKLFNDLYHRKLRKNFQKGCYSGCMKNCPGTKIISQEDFEKKYHCNLK